MSLSHQISGYWDRIYSHYKVPITIGNRHYKGPCPLCGKKEKFRLFKDWLLTGGYVCSCSSSGNGINLLKDLRNATYAEIAKELKELLDIKDDKPNAAPIVDESKKKILEFIEMPILKGTDGETYLKSRGINILPFSGVKFSPDQKFYKEKSYPAMYAIASNENGVVQYIHCTYIVDGQKIDRHDAKKIFSVANTYGDSFAVRMFPFKNVLGISEGIETGLSCAQRYDTPVWSTLNSVNMKKFKAPKGVKHLVVFADNDPNGTGLAAAFDCGRSNILMPNDVIQVTIIWPAERGDFNDMDTGDITDAKISWKLNK